MRVGWRRKKKRVRGKKIWSLEKFPECQDRSLSRGTRDWTELQHDRQVKFSIAHIQFSSDHVYLNEDDQINFYDDEDALGVLYGWQLHV